MQVRRALPKTPKQEAVGDDPCTLYVRGLQADVDRDRLEAMFQVLAIFHFLLLSVAELLGW